MNDLTASSPSQATEGCNLGGCIPERRDSERGSALIMTLMVMVILTVIGLSYLVLSDTENQIAVADRDGRQVLYVAMSGAKLAESWFNIPDPAYNAFVPERADCNLSLRVGDTDYDGVNDVNVPVNGNGQRYRGGTSTGAYRLFDKPFRGAVRDTFWGSADAPDVLITNDPALDGEYLDEMSLLFNTDDSASLEGVRIDEIRIFAPPLDQDLQRRFGICTISVTASKVLAQGSSRRRVSERTVSVVLQELPFPAPGAAIETSAAIDMSGNFAVNWGGAYTELDIDPQQGANFPGPAIPRENTSRFRYADFSPNAPDLDAAVGTQTLLTQLLTGDAGGPVELADPWINMRASGQITSAPNTDDQPWPYLYSVGITDDRSTIFQNQTYNFPELDYNFWKRYTQQRARNANYFKYAGSATFKRNGVGPAETFAHWTNTENPGVEPGLFFFDTQNAQNPQNGGPGILVPETTLNSSDIDSPSGEYIMEGVIYLNSTTVTTSGIGSAMAERTVNMPGEPFLDTGIDLDRNGVIGNTFEEIETIGNNIWDFAYLTSTESDGADFDANYGTAEFNAFETDHRVGDGVVPDAGDDPRILPDTIHEPFLNLAYPPPGSALDPLIVDYDIEATVTRTMGGDRDENTVQDRMTSLRDIRGAQVNLELFLNGVFYNEGNYDGQGNMSFFGSLLFKAGFNVTGTPNVYFNEGLVLGDFPPASMRIPRVYTSQVQTD